MDFTDTNFLDNLLNFFYEHSVTGMIQLQPHAFELVCVLAIIDICSTWALYDGQMRMSFVINKVMKVGFFLLLIVNWDTINSAILRSFEIAGATASGLSNIGAGDWISPSKILERGFNICGTLFKDFQDTGITDNGGIARLFMDLIAIAITIASFFFISLQVLITKIEFCIFSSLGVILLPFGAIRFTSFLFQRVFSFGVKLMIMYFLLGLFDTLSGTLTSFEENVSFSSMLKMALSYATLAFLVWKLPNLAASMMNGQPSMEAGDVVRGATTAKSTVAGAVGGAVGAAGAVSRVAGKTAAGYGFANATIKAAQANIGVQGGSVAGEVAKNVARTSFANSAIGKGLIRGANRALNQMEDYKNLKTGEYATKPQSNRNR